MTAALAPRATRLDWSLETLVLLLVGAEAAVVALLTVALFSGLALPHGGFWLGWVFLVLLLGTNLQRAMDAYRFFSPQYEILSVAALVALVLGTIRAIVFAQRPPADLGWFATAWQALAHPSDPLSLPVWYAIVLVAYAWWRGRTRDDPSIDAAYRTLRVGTPFTVVAILATMTVAGSGDDAILRRGLYAGAIAFLGLTLAAIALGRLRVEQARGALTLTPRWLLTFLAPIAGLLLVGTLVAGIFTRRFLETLLWLLTPLFRLIDFLLLVLVYVATGFAWVLFTILSFLIERLGGGNATPPPTRSPVGTPAADPLAGAQPIHPPDGLRYVVVAAILIALLFILTRFLWRRRPRRPVAPGEERESIFSWELLATGAADLLGGLGARFRRPPDPLADLRGDARWQHTVVIREIYTRLLRRGADAERPRAAAQTPDEYVPVVGATAPLAAVRDLTERYDGARYDERPATAEDAAAARAAWEAIERTRRGDTRG
jgi:hypothetical protein